MSSKNWGFLLLGAAILNSVVTVLLLLASRASVTNPVLVLNGIDSIANQGIFTTVFGYVVAVYLIKKRS
ncbi:MAG: hypothetical protein Q7K26_04565 [bacterium]|nr:hypothetical protein [bacterium]